MSAQNQPLTTNAARSPVSSGASGSTPPNWITAHPGVGKSEFYKALFNQASNPGAPSPSPFNYNVYLPLAGDAFHISEEDILDEFCHLIGLSSAAPDFSSATAAVSTGTSWSDLDFRQRLAEQLERDADKIRRSCAVVRDPSKPREITYAAPNDMMAITRLVCGG